MARKIFSFDRGAAQAALRVREREQKREAARKAQEEERQIWQQMVAEEIALHRHDGQHKPSKPQRAPNRNTAKERHELCKLIEKLFDEQQEAHEKWLKGGPRQVLFGKYVMDWWRYAALCRVYGQVFPLDPRLTYGINHARRMYLDMLGEHTRPVHLSDLEGPERRNVALIVIGQTVVRKQVRKAAREAIAKAPAEMRTKVHEKLIQIREHVRKHRREWEAEGRKVPSIFEVGDPSILIGRVNAKSKAVKVITTDDPDG